MEDFGLILIAVVYLAYGVTCLFCQKIIDKYGITMSMVIGSGLHLFLMVALLMSIRQAE